MADALTQALAQALRVYSPTTLSWTGPDGTSQVLNGTGGGLVEAVEQNGIAVLGQVVSAGCVLEMTDSGVQLEIRRDGSDLLLRVSWADGPAYEERIAVTVASLPMPEVSAASTSSPSTLAVESNASLPIKGAPVDDL